MNTVRNALDTVRYNWLGASIGGPDASMGGQWLVLIVSAALVFGCFFALGRYRSSGSPQGGGSAALPVFSERAAIPGALRGGSPAAGAVPTAIATPPPPQPVVRRANAESVRAAEAAQLFAAEATRASAPSTAVPVETAPAPQPVPTEAKTPSRSGAGSHAAKPRSSSRGGGSSGGGSFDSSE
jgi:hypothetical protein